MHDIGFKYHTQVQSHSNIIYSGVFYLKPKYFENMAASLDLRLHSKSILIFKFLVAQQSDDGIYIFTSLLFEQLPLK